MSRTVLLYSLSGLIDPSSPWGMPIGGIERFAPLADRVVLFKRESQRVDQCMAARASRVPAVLCRYSRFAPLFSLLGRTTHLGAQR